MARTVVFLCVLIMAVSHGAPPYPFMDPALPWDKRVDDLVSRLTLEEIVPQTSVSGSIPEIPRLGIKPYVWNSECLRGEVSTNTTAFPQSIGLAATFKWVKCSRYNNYVTSFLGYQLLFLICDCMYWHNFVSIFSKGLLYEMAEAISFELRAHWNGNVKQNIYKDHSGLSCFSPVINIMRHPLWGRNQVNHAYKIKDNQIRWLNILPNVLS